MTSKKNLLIILAVLLLLPSHAHAIQMEYYTYNGFDPIVGAFSKIALIFSDGNYKALLGVAMILGLSFSGMAVYIKSMATGQASLASWFVPSLIGIVLYMGLIIPKGTLHVYDPVKNKTKTIGGIPDGIVALVGSLNAIERGLVDIVSTAGDPVSFTQQAGGIGFDMLYNIHSKGVLLTDLNVHRSVSQYTKDCVFFEMTRAGTTLTINELSSNADFVSLFEKANSPSIFTVFYSDTSPGGATMTCSDAFTALKTAITKPALYTSTIKARCADAGFDPTIPSELNQCKTMMESLASWLEGASYSVQQIYQQKVMAEAINETVLSASPDTAMQMMANRNTGTGMMAAGVSANEWIPIVRAVITAIAIGLLPFLVMFIPTPLFGKAASLIAGFFVWLTAWGITDAVIHQFAIDYSYKAFEEVRQYQLGLVAINSFGTASLKTLAVFGSIRWAGMTLATVMTGMLIRFGGHALSSLAGQATSMPQQGASTASALATPEGRAGMLGAVEGATATFANAHRFGFGDRVSSRENTMSESQGRGSGLGDVESAYGTGVTTGQFAVGHSAGTRAFANDVAGGDVAEAAKTSTYFSSSKQLGANTGEFQALQSLTGVKNPTEAAQFTGSGSLITPKIADHATANNQHGIIPGMKLNGFSFDSSTGNVASIAATGPVTNENIGALRELFNSGGRADIGNNLKPGMIANYTVDPATGKGTMSASNATETISTEQGKETLSGVTVSAGGKNYEIAAGTMTQNGNELLISGQTKDGSAISMQGSVASMRRDKDNNLQSMEMAASKISTDQAITSHATLSPDQLKTLIPILKAQGAPSHALAGMKYMADQGKGADVTTTAPTDGSRMATMSVSGGGKSELLNQNLSKAGYENIKQAMNISESGNRATQYHDVHRDIFGPSFEGAGLAARSGNTELYRDVADKKFATEHPQEHKALVAKLATSIVGDNKLMSQRGVQQGSSSLRAGLSAEVGVSFGGSISEESVETTTTDTRISDVIQQLNNNNKVSWGSGDTHTQTMAYQAKNIQASENALLDKHSRKTSSDFGKWAGAQKISEALNDTSKYKQADRPFFIGGPGPNSEKEDLQN